MLFGGLDRFLFSLRGIPAPTNARSTASLPRPTLITTARTAAVLPASATTPLSPDAVFMDLAHLDEIHADVLCQEEGLTVVELGTTLSRLGRMNLDDRVLGCGAAAHLLGLLVGECQMQERTTPASKSILLSTTSVPTADPYEQELGRIGALARVHGEGVSV